MDKKKALPAAAMLNSQILPLLRPYLSRFERWNQQSAHLNALLLSRSANARELDRCYAELEKLADEVEEHFAAFERTARPLPYHSRVEDLRAAFDRLRTNLRNTIAPSP